MYANICINRYLRFVLLHGSKDGECNAPDPSQPWSPSGSSFVFRPLDSVGSHADSLNRRGGGSENRWRPVSCQARVAWSRNRSFGPDSGMGESGNKRENWINHVSDQLPLISKVRIGEICITEMGLDIRNMPLQSFTAMHTFTQMNVYYDLC